MGIKEVDGDKHGGGDHFSDLLYKCNFFIYFSIHDCYDESRFSQPGSDMVDCTACLNKRKNPVKKTTE